MKFSLIGSVWLVFNLSISQNELRQTTKDSLRKELEYTKIVYGIRQTENDTLFNNQTLEAINFFLSTQKYAKTYECTQRLKKIDKQINTEEILFLKLYSSFLNNDYATTELEWIMASDSSAQFSERNLKLYILSLNEQSKWKESNDVFKHHYIKLTNVKKYDSLLISNLYTKTPKLKNIEKAKKLNIFLPPSGFFYVKKGKEGIISGSLQIVSLGLAGFLAYQKLFINAGVIGLGLLMKFREGSIKRVELLTNQYNEKVTKEYNLKLKKLLLK